MRRILAWLLILHSLAHTFAGTWTSARNAFWPSLLWGIAAVGYLAVGLGLLRVPVFRRHWKAVLLAATFASMVLMVWYMPPYGAIGMTLDVAMFIALMGPFQQRFDADIDVVEHVGTDAFNHPLVMKTVWAIGILSFAYVVLALAARPVSLRWGSTAAERAEVLPGDEVHPPIAFFKIDHAITIHAPVAAIWPWLMQLGQDRGGFYSYDWLERAAGDRIRNADRVHSEWLERHVGDTVLATQREFLGGKLGTLGWRVNVLDSARVIGLENWGTFVLQPIDSNTTRLIVRTRGDGASSLMAFLFATVEVYVFEPAHFIMERGMLRGIRDRAEKTARG